MMAAWPLKGVATGTPANGSGVAVAVSVGVTGVGVSVGVGSRRTNGSTRGGLLRMAVIIKLMRVIKKVLLISKTVKKTASAKQKYFCQAGVNSCQNAEAVAMRKNNVISKRPLYAGLLNWFSQTTTPLAKFPEPSKWCFD
jgi:hypothetical protein